MRNIGLGRERGGIRMGEWWIENREFGGENPTEDKLKSTFQKKKNPFIGQNG